MRFRKTMLVERDYCKPAKMTIEINDNYLFANIEGKIMFVDFCKYLLENTNIIKNKYRRTCPYKLKVSKHYNDNVFSHRSYDLEYLEIRDNNLFKKETNIINLYGTYFRIEGNLKLFIPDLLLVMENRGYIARNSQDKFVQVRDLSELCVKIIESSPIYSPQELKDMGYTVPSKYCEKYRKMVGW